MENPETPNEDLCEKCVEVATSRAKPFADARIIIISNAGTKR